MSENKEIQEQPQEPVKYPYSVAICFRGAGKPYSFGVFDKKLEKGDWVVVETAQGLEMGQVEADPLSIEKYGLSMPTKGVVRTATEKDHEAYQKNLADESKAFDICNEQIQELKLDMNLLSAQYTLNRDKVLFIYLADQRVDFRELLKHLGSTLHCRIELRQIGERDKAKMVGGIGMCGMECCCSRFKNHFDVISINMAKNQLLALNIDKLSGMCGKLKCCLKYEDDDYKQLTEGLPKMGSQVEYEGQIYRVTSMNVMSEEAKLENRETAIFISLEDLRTKTISRKGVIPKKKETTDDKPARKTVIHTNKPQEVKKEDRVLKAPQSNTEVRTFGKKDKPKNVETRNFGRKAQAEKPKEAKNVTVRTFGKKKKDSEVTK